MNMKKTGRNRSRESTARPREGTTRPPGRKPYAPPSVVEFGTIAKLTQAGGSSKTETGVPLMKTCL